MYFAITGKNSEISRHELEILNPTNISSPKKNILTFSTESPQLMGILGACIKSGRVIRESDLKTLLQDTKIIGIESETNGTHLKKTLNIKRFKKVPLQHTDREIKEKGKEIINLGRGDYGIVDNYQPIDLYEAIDFGKPGRSMHMGMMPAKLTHILINLGIHDNYKDAIIYDPFAGSGTTLFLANYLGYNTRGSDIQTKYLEQNIPRWKTTRFYNPDKTIEYFTQDISKPINNSTDSLHASLIITEGRLGPIVTAKTSTAEKQENIRKIQILYTQFLNFIAKNKHKKAVFTLPQYLNYQNTRQTILQEHAKKLHYTRSEITELYYREGQQVARKIIILEKK